MDQSDINKYLAGHLKQIAREEEDLRLLTVKALKKAYETASNLAIKYNVWQGISIWLTGPG